MTMTTINLDNGTTLELEPARHLLRMTPAVGGANLELTIRAIAAAPVGRVVLAAAVYVADSTQMGRRFLCRALARSHVVPVGRGAEVVLQGLISSEQLRAVEELRAGGNLTLGLEVEVHGVMADPLGPVVWSGQLNIPVSAGEWSTQVENVDGGTVVEILVGMPDDPQLVGAVDRLREARHLLRTNQIVSALEAARKAVEPVLEAAREGNLASTALKKNAKERELPERFAVMIEAVYSLLSGAAHDDAVTEGFRYTRAEADALLVSVAGLVKRLAVTHA